MNKKELSEADIRAKYITPALLKVGWDEHTQIGREIYFTAGRIYVKGQKTKRGRKKFADYILYYKSNIPIAIIEAKDNMQSIGAGMQQALAYAETLDIPFVFSSNGDAFLFHDKTSKNGLIEQTLSLDEFPSPTLLWNKYKANKSILDSTTEKVVEQDYFHDNTGRNPRYYQQIAINRTVEAIAKGNPRILLVMATGTGKTYTAFQIAYRLWKAKSKKRILFLADRTALIDQTLRGDFRHFKDAMTIIKKKIINIDGKEKLISSGKRGIDSSDKAFDVFLGLYQGLSNSDPDVPDAFRDFSPDFFDLIIVDECHRGSASENSKWRSILEYFHNATQIGMTATPKETEDISNSMYFGDPIYTYSLKQGIEDGFLAPYKVIRVTLDIDANGWRPPKGFLDKEGKEVEDRIYNRTDFDKNIIVDERRTLVARKISEFLRTHGKYSKTIVFCVDIEHAEGMRTALVNENADMVSINSKYVMRITGDNPEGKNELDNFINPEERYPVIATTSKLMTTGVDAQTCKLIVLDSEIKSPTEFKQIIGRGTRINEEHGKDFFTILDFRNVTDIFADPNFDGDPIRIMENNGDEEPMPTPDEEDIDELITEDGEEINFPEPLPYSEFEDTPSIVQDPIERRRKVNVAGIPVTIINERVQYLDVAGNLITETLLSYTQKQIKNKFVSLNQFQEKWNKTVSKQSIIDEMEQQGILFDFLKEEVGRDYDPFDLICHIAFDVYPLTRAERAKNVKKRNYFTKYSEKAQAVIQSLLDKYAVDGVITIESMEALRLDPINKLGSPIEIIKAFGGKEAYRKALFELENELYKVA